MRLGGPSYDQISGGAGSDLLDGQQYDDIVQARDEEAHEVVGGFGVDDYRVDHLDSVVSWEPAQPRRKSSWRAGSSKTSATSTDTICVAALAVVRPRPWQESRIRSDVPAYRSLADLEEAPNSDAGSAADAGPLWCAQLVRHLSGAGLSTQRANVSVSVTVKNSPPCL